MHVWCSALSSPALGPGEDREGGSCKGGLEIANKEVSAAHWPGTLAHDKCKVQVLSKWAPG